MGSSDRMPPGARTYYAFDRFRLDTQGRVLLEDGQPVSLTPKLLDTLLALVRSNRQLLTRADLMRQVWPDAHVAACNLAVNISLLRKLLNNRKNSRGYIETVRKRGYRFSADVRELLGEEPGADGQRRPEQQSLGVLPFRNLRPQADLDYFGFALADAIITELGSVSAFSVRPSAAVLKYRSRAVDPRKAAAELQADRLLTGNFLREGKALRITAQLIDTVDNRVVWRDVMTLRWDRVLAVQDRAVQRITAGLRSLRAGNTVPYLRPSGSVIRPLSAVSQSGVADR